jgi:chitin disaccharide deacetylase
MKFILNADDFGLDQDTVDATIRCFENGGLTSATIMVNMPATEQAFAYARDHTFSFGVHLTYVSDTVERPVLDPSLVQCLCRPDGRFRDSNDVRKDALFGRLSVKEIAAETSAQIQKALEAGVPVSHVDSHGHLHKFKPFREALRMVLPRFGITRVRAVQDVYLKTPWKRPGYWLGFLLAGGIRRVFRTTDHFYMPRSVVETGWIDKFLSRDLSVQGIFEVGFHPGSQEDWRVVEARECIEFANALDRVGYGKLTWNDL